MAMEKVNEIHLREDSICVSSPCTSLVEEKSDSSNHDELHYSSSGVFSSPCSRRKRKSWTAEEKKTFWSEKKREKKEAKRKRREEIGREQQMEWESLDEMEREERRQKALQKHEERRKQEKALDEQCRNQLSDSGVPRLVFDLSFAWCMTPGNIKSTVAQILFSYSTLRRAGFPFYPVITSLAGSEDGKTGNSSTNSELENDGLQEARLENLRKANSNSLSAKSAEGFSPSLKPPSTALTELSNSIINDADGIAGPPSSSAVSHTSASVESLPLLASLLTCSAFKKYGCPIYINEHWSTIFKKETVVFLTADADTVLDRVERNTVYIIGAFVDHNQHKLLSLNAAVRHGVRTARLPIKENIDVRNRCQILTINHVVDVLTQFMIKNSWQDALETVLPVRRLHQEELGSRKKRRRFDAETPVFQQGRRENAKQPCLKDDDDSPSEGVADTV